MTEQEKENQLILFREILRQMEPQLEIPQLEALHQKMLNDINSSADVVLRPHLLALPSELLEVISRNKRKLAAIQRQLRYIESTDAAALTWESIKAQGETE